MRKGLIAILFSTVCLSIWAQNAADTVKKPLKPRFLYNVDAVIWFDNREYKSPYQIQQTLFAIRLSPEIGVGLSDKEGGDHNLIAGVHYIQPIGGNWRDVRFHPTVYYQYLYNGFSMRLGTVPYKYFIRQLPDYLRYDSIAYVRPNIQGALIQYQSEHGYVEAMCDWRGMQQPDQREMFQVTIDGEYSYQGLFRYSVGGLAEMNHKAGCAPPTPYEDVCDEAFLSPNIGIDFSAPTPLNVLSLRASYIFSYQCQRSDNTKYRLQGMLLEFMINWRWLGMKNTFYYGDNLMPLYGMYGAYFNQGDPFYQSKMYNRTDFYIYLVRKSFINCYFSWNLHWEPLSGLQHQQQVIAVFSLDGIKKDGLLRGLFDK